MNNVSHNCRKAFQFQWLKITILILVHIESSLVWLVGMSTCQHLGCRIPHFVALPSSRPPCLLQDVWGNVFTERKAWKWLAFLPLTFHGHTQVQGRLGNVVVSLVGKQSGCCRVNQQDFFFFAKIKLWIVIYLGELYFHIVLSESNKRNLIDMWMKPPDLKFFGVI